MLSRDLEDRAVGEPEPHRWYGSRRVGLMLMSLHLKGEAAIAGRAGRQRLFGFHYLLEMFVPPAKREYGYYLLPILRGTELIGRIEPIFDRKRGLLAVNGAWAQPGAPVDAGPGIRHALEELAAWLGADRIEVGRTVPRRWSSALCA